MTPPAWVVDTNVLVSGALTAGSTCDRILRAAVADEIRLAWSAPILAEYRAVLSRPKFSFSPEVVASLLAAFGQANQVTPEKAPPLPDPDDEVFLATALATADRILVTGNCGHFPAEICSPVLVLTPAQALKRLSNTSAEQ